ncbi:hypothetical protein [Candidatus Ichthyocystis hellenicum]|uniref:hypothetical protein n=1 Tax=Candidatus Ichthyocystis hellenicum TaxID=1561003 RepID=UPI000B87CDE0|nr:hypothetical protein [Candidatus Ichthyocystis hellenicum]
MKKTLSIVGAILSAVIISGCLDSDSSKTNSSNKGTGALTKNPLKTGYIGSIKIPDRTVLPEDIVFDPLKESLIVSGSGKKQIERGQIWEAGMDDPVFSYVPLITAPAETFLKGAGIAYDAFSEVLYACSNPGNRLATVNPTVVVFRRSPNNELVWESAINFETANLGQRCAKLQILDGYLFATNEYAVDDGYAAVYSADIEDNPLPTEFGVSVKYSDLGYVPNEAMVNKRLLSSIQRVEHRAIGEWKLLVLDQNKRSIYKIVLDLPTQATDPLEIEPPILALGIPTDIEDPSVFINRDDELMFIAGKNSIYSVKYSKEGTLLESQKFTDLTINMNVKGMSFGQDRFGTTIYPAFFIVSSTLQQGSYFTVDEFAFDPVTGM